MQYPLKYQNKSLQTLTVKYSTSSERFNKPRIAKTFLNNNRILGGITISDLLLSYRAIEIKLHGIGIGTGRLINKMKSKTLK